MIKCQLVNIKLWSLSKQKADSIFFQLKEKNQQISKSVLGFQTQLYPENSCDNYIIMIYFSLVKYVTLINLTEQVTYPSWDAASALSFC